MLQNSQARSGNLPAFAARFTISKNLFLGKFSKTAFGCCFFISKGG